MSQVSQVSQVSETQISEITSNFFSSPDLQKKPAKKTSSFLDDDSEVSDEYQSGNHKKKSKVTYNNVDGLESDDSSFQLNQSEEYVSNDELEYDSSDSDRPFEPASGSISLQSPKLSKAEKDRSTLKPSSVRGDKRERNLLQDHH